MGSSYGVPFTILLILACGLYGCTDGDTALPQRQAPEASLPTAPDGYFTGSVAVINGASSGGSFYGEALITKDGLIRVNDLGGTGAQFSGTGMLIADQFIGSGTLIGEICEGASYALCGQVIPATVNLNATTRDRLRGEILAVSGPVTAIGLDMGWHWSATRYYLQPAALSRVSGIYSAGIPFPADSTLNDMIVTIADDGQVFIQSAATGCTASGNLTPHLDAAVGVYDIDLAFVGCAASYLDLNANLTGIVTSFCHVPEEVFEPAGEGLVIWLNTADDSRPLLAKTIRAWRLGTRDGSGSVAVDPSSLDPLC